ncbi:acyl-coenzyme A thioesterase 13-like isoform X2 [Herrania umbratica]|uniref:Acyl-coenzyme A thioesterase 13-like isoform X2 n=1 Tax=Herrania umbratica TaxID=108875 RepID=A0A6J0ZIS1_9ROSI|nr:acyl-coenzyme A thioesterase 13-like isoform X2 [Herrania umbratica]
MDKETVKEYLENSANIDGDELPLRFFERLIMHGLRVDLIEIGRVICTFKVPPRLLNGSNYLHGGATATLVDLVGSAAVYTVGAPFTGVSVEINVTFMDAAYADEEIEIEARALLVGKAVAVLSVEFRKKNTGKIFAQGRHTKHLSRPSKIV